MNLGFRAETQTGYQNASDGNTDAFFLSELNTTNTQIAEKWTTKLEVQRYEASAVMHSAMHCKFKIVTVKAIKAML